MKFIFVALLAVVASCNAFSMTPAMIELAVACAAENKVDLAKFEPGKELDPKIFENHDYRCFGKCMALKSGLISESGEPNMEKIKEVFQASDEVMLKVKKCNDDNKQADICDRVFASHECSMKQLKN